MNQTTTFSVATNMRKSVTPCFSLRPATAGSDSKTGVSQTFPHGIRNALTSSPFLSPTDSDSGSDR